MSLLHTDGGADGLEGRYGQFRLEDGELVVYDRENVSVGAPGGSTGGSASGWTNGRSP